VGVSPNDSNNCVCFFGEDCGDACRVFVGDWELIFDIFCDVFSISCGGVDCDEDWEDEAGCEDWDSLICGFAKNTSFRTPFLASLCTHSSTGMKLSVTNFCKKQIRKVVHFSDGQLSATTIDQFISTQQLGTTTPPT
jgi:hypothetical protein